MSTKFEKIAQLKKDYEAALKEVGKDAFTELLAPLFAKFPNVKAVRWTQYTPYFNDGDPCTFRCGAEDCDIDFGDPEVSNDEDDDTSFTSEYSDVNYEVPERRAVFTAFGTALAAIEDDIFESVFGDHVQVVANSDGTFEVEEYDHS